MLRRIKSAVITTISLCRMGKNGMRTLFKDDGSIQFETLVKATAENELLAVIYAPERPDDDSDFADAPVIKGMAHEYLRDHRNLDIEHDGKKLASSAAYVAESFIIAKGDERFQNWKNYQGEPVGDLTGAWASVIKLEEPALQKAYRDGELDGVSMFGRAAVEHVDTTAAAKRVADRLAKARNQQGEIQMDETKLKELLSGFKAEVITMVKSAIDGLKPEAKPEVKPSDEPKAPVFKGSISDPKALEAFENELRSYELQKALAAGTLTADAILEMRKALAVGEPSDTEAEIKPTDSPKEKELKRELFKVRKARNAPERGGAGEDSEAELRKANEDEGLNIAKVYNERHSAPAGGMRVVPKA